MLSMPSESGDIRGHLSHKPEVVSELLTIFLRAVQTTVRQRSPYTSAGDRLGRNGRRGGSRSSQKS